MYAEGYIARDDFEAFVLYVVFDVCVFKNVQVTGDFYVFNDGSAD